MNVLMHFLMHCKNRRAIALGVMGALAIAAPATAQDVRAGGVGFGITAGTTRITIETTRGGWPGGGLYYGYPNPIYPGLYPTYHPIYGSTVPSCTAACLPYSAYPSAPVYPATRYPAYNYHLAPSAPTYSPYSSPYYAPSVPSYSRPYYTPGYGYPAYRY